MAELIVALDVDSFEKALSLADNLRDAVKWVKVGLELFTCGGPELVRELSKRGFDIFLDLKLYDIPNTVARAVMAAGKLNVKMMTLHLSGGEKMCRAALEAARPEQMLLGVTALTSFADGEMPGITMPVGEYARFVADKAASWGLKGIVCSPLEVAGIRARHPQFLCVCPGIRIDSGSSRADDQSRVSSPEMAARDGADFLVCGRPIVQSDNPREAALEILRRMK